MIPYHQMLPCRFESAPSAKRRYIGIISVILVGLFASVPCLQAEPEANQPNIIFIYVDDLDFDEIGVYDYRQTPTYTGAEAAGVGPKVSPPIRQNQRVLKSGETLHYKDLRMLTPHLDQLAADGMRFDRFYVTSAACTPSRYTALTGRLASRSPALLEKYPVGGPLNLRWNSYLLPEESSLIKELEKLGYRTGMVGKWHNGEPKAVHQGVSPEADPHDPEVIRRIQKAHDAGIQYLQDKMGFDVATHVSFGNKEGWRLPEVLKVHNLEWITDGAVQFIENSKEPFFLYVAYPVPHGVYFADWANGDTRATPRGFLSKAPQVQPSRASVLKRLEMAGIREKRNALATWIDDSIGAIVHALKSKGQVENTLIAVVSDHQARGKNSCYEGVRVPAIFFWPQHIKPESVSSVLAANTDLAPTFIQAAGGVVPQDMAQDGKSLLPLLEGKAKKHHEFVFLEMHNSRAVVTDRWKLLLNRPTPEIQARMKADALRAEKENRPRQISWDGIDGKSKWDGVWFYTDRIFPNYFAENQLYDLKNDLFEQENLYLDPQRHATVKDLKRLLKDKVGSLPHAFAIE